MHGNEIAPNTGGRAVERWNARRLLADHKERMGIGAQLV